MFLDRPDALMIADTGATAACLSHLSKCAPLLQTESYRHWVHSLCHFDGHVSMAARENKRRDTMLVDKGGDQLQMDEERLRLGDRSVHHKHQPMPPRAVRL